MPISLAASGESIIATPSEASRAPITSKSTLLSPATFVTEIVSPGRYPTVLANNPSGNTPSSTTTALPSKEGLKDDKIRHPATTKTNFENNLNLFFISLPILKNLSFI